MVALIPVPTFEEDDGVDETALDPFDTDEEDFGNEDLSPLKIDWLDLTFAGGHSQLIGLSALPGCKFMEINRNISQDIGYLVQKGIENVVILCTQGELTRCRVPDILTYYENAGITPYHFPIDDSKDPEFKAFHEILQKLNVCINEEKKTLIHCVAGVGRSCLVAGLLLMELDTNIQEETVIQKMKSLRGSCAIQTVKQFNFLNEYREIKNKSIMQVIIEPPTPCRSVSR